MGIVRVIIRQKNPEVSTSYLISSNDYLSYIFVWLSWFLKAGVHMNSSKERSIVPDIPEHDSSLQDLIGNDYYINKVESNDRAIKNLSEDFFTDDSSKIPDEDEDEDNILTEKDMYFIITQDLMSLLEEMKYS